MQYHVAREGQQLGTVSEADLKAGLAEGRFLPTDLAWGEGMTQWTPLGDLRLLGAPAPLRPPGTPAYAAAPQGLPQASSGLATTSLISGIASMLLCGLGGIATLIAIITGHMALGRIKRSGGAIGGRGMAIAGLIMGYMSILSILAGIGFVTAFMLPAIAKAEETTDILMLKAALLETHEGCLIYAEDNDGAYPATLDELVAKHHLGADKLQRLNSLKPKSWKGEPGFEYFGAGKKDSIPGETKILVGRAESPEGERIVLYHDGTVEQMEVEQQ